MIFGAHVIVYSKDAEADRAFFRDILGFPSWPSTPPKTAASRSFT